MSGHYARFVSMGVGTCPDCGKQRFTTRRKARRAARIGFPGQTLRAYLCGGSWHVGHNSAWLKHGETRDPKFLEVSAK